MMREKIEFEHKSKGEIKMKKNSRTQVPGKKDFFELVRNKVTQDNKTPSRYWEKVSEILAKEEVIGLWTLENKLRKQGMGRQLSVRLYRYRKKGVMKKEAGKHGVLVFRVNGKTMVTTIKHLDEVKKLDGLEGYWVF